MLLPGDATQLAGVVTQEPDGVMLHAGRVTQSAGMETRVAEFVMDLQG